MAHDVKGKQLPIELQNSIAGIQAQIPELPQFIYKHVANGGSVLDLAELWRVSYAEIMQWVRFDKESSRLYDQALIDRSEWAKEQILRELRRLGSIDIRTIFKPDGSIKPIDEWSSDIGSIVQSMEIVEEFEGSGREKLQIGYCKKIKFWNKEKALELLGKNLSMFIETYEVKQTFSLADLVVNTIKDVDEQSDSSS